MTVSRCRGSHRSPAHGVLLPALLGSLALVWAGGAPAASPAPAPASTPARRVVLISLDAAGSRMVHALYRQGVLDAGGFARFFREGEVADALVPVDPTLTSVNHISLATGFPPASTGIVANFFHPAGAPFTDRMSGFQAPIGTETLWEAARRQGLRVGVLSWPGADAKGERRTADWGLVFNNDPEIRSEVMTMEPTDWQPAPPGSPPPAAGGAAPLSARVTLGGEKGAPSREMELYAFDSGAGGGKIDCDRIAVTSWPQPAAGGVPPAPLHVGDWTQLTWPAPGGGSVASWIKFLSLKRDLTAATFAVGGIYRTIAYPDSFAASLDAAGLHWPGAPEGDALQGGWQGDPAGIDLATWTAQAERLAAFMGKTIRLAAARNDWDLLMGYFSVLDDAGHALLMVDERQPGFSPQRRDELARARRRVWRAVDHELAELLATLDLTRTTVVVVSDHGMTPVHTAINPNAPLADLGLLAAPAAPAAAATAPGATAVTPPAPTGAAPAPSAAAAAPSAPTAATAPATPTTPAGAAPTVAAPAAGSAARRPVAYAIADGGVANIYLDARGNAAAKRRLLAAIARRFAAWRIGGKAPIDRIFRRHETALIGLDHPNSGDLVVFARPGFVFRMLPGGKSSAPAPLLGAHGYLNIYPNMRASYMALGAGVKPNHGRSVGTVPATAVAPRIAAWLHIAPPRRTITPPAGSAGGAGPAAQ